MRRVPYPRGIFAYVLLVLYILAESISSNREVIGEYLFLFSWLEIKIKKNCFKHVCKLLLCVKW